MGLYAGSRSIPFLGLAVALWQERVATNDALSWDLATAGSRESKAAYRILYPAYGTYVGGSAQTITDFIVGGWIPYAVQGGVIVAGHIVGQTRALFVREREGGLEPDVIDGPPETERPRCGAPRALEILEHETGLEPATPTLATWRSTN